MQGLSPDTGGGGMGIRPPGRFVTTETQMPLKDARLTSSKRLYEEHQNQSKANSTNLKLPYAFNFKIATLNVRSLLKQTMHKQIIDYMRLHDIHVLCLQETRSKNTTQYVVDKFTFMTVSTTSPNQPEYAGVGFVLSPVARHALIRTTFVNSRLARISLLISGGELNILNTYVPQNARPEEERRAHFEQLQNAISKIEHKGPFVILGDFNSRIHGKLHGEDDVIGPHIFGKGWTAIGDDSDNRFLLVDLCRGLNLLIANTWFQQPSGRQVTYKEPGTRFLPPTNSRWDPHDFAQLDFCLIPRRWRNACQSIYSQPRANLDSDHFPVVLHLRIKLGAKQNPVRYPRWNFRNATADQVDSMNQELEMTQALDPAPLNNPDPTQRWGALSALYVQALDKHIPKQRAQPRQPWITQGTLDLIERRGQLRTQGHMDKVADLNKEIRKAAKVDKRTWLDEQLSTGDWRPITNLKKPFPQKALMLVDQTGQGGNIDNAEILANHLALNQWKEAGEPTGLSTAPLFTDAPTISEATISLEEVTLAIKQSKVGKRAGKDTIPNDFWKRLKGAGLLELVSLFRLCWETQSSPEQWKMAQVVGIFKKGSATDPANYRPISLLQTCYKLYARIIANRLTVGLDDKIRDLQFGFRKGRSTSEAIYLVRRLQDLVDAKKHQVLYLMFLDWSKAFDKIRPSALHIALQRLGVPSHMCSVIRDLVSNPLFEVIMDDHVSGCKEQRSGIRQGCTLSPLLFILLQTVLFHDVQVAYLNKHPLSVTPQIPFFDVEFADDTVLIARTQQHMQDLLWFVQDEASKYNLLLNTDKTKLILYNSEATVAFRDGNLVPQVSSIVYLGGLIDQTGKPAPEVRRRLGEAKQVFQKLKRVWRHARLSTRKKIRIYKACVVSKLLYNLSTLWLTDSQMNQIDSFHYRCLRAISNIPTTWGAMQQGIERTSNEDVRARLHETLLSDEIRLYQLKLLGHILRRPIRHPSRIVSFNRFLEPQILGGPFRPGNRRGKWTEHVLATAMTIFNDHFFRGEGGQRDIKNKICEVANDRVWWSRVLGETRGRWRRQREGPVVHAQGG